jgi:hypothetical protein
MKWDVKKKHPVCFSIPLARTEQLTF